MARARHEPRRDPDHGQEPRAYRRDGGHNPPSPNHDGSFRGGRGRILRARRSRAAARLRAGRSDLVARKHPRYAGYAGRDGGAGGGGSPRAQMTRLTRKQHPNAEIATRLRVDDGITDDRLVGTVDGTGTRGTWNL